MHPNIEQILSSFIKSLENNTFVKISCGDYRGEEENMKNLYVRKILIKDEEHLSFVYRYKTKDITKNYPLEEAKSIVKTSIHEKAFRYVHLATTEYDLKLQHAGKGKFLLRQEAASITTNPNLQHDKQKSRIIEAKGKSYLAELKITDKSGKVYKSTQDKYKQINHYIEILSSLLKALPQKPSTRIVDMGSGKGYLTFALYDYLNNVLEKPSTIVGVEYRKELVDLCNDIALRSEFGGLSFEEGTIESYSPKEDINILIALHACDTATDEAIYKGINSQADLIVAAPCCHKQIRREIEKNKAENNLGFLMQHGIFLERQAEMVTDGIRALILEYYGYSTKVMEFISDAHTPKNVLVIGIKSKKDSKDQASILEKIKNIKTYFGIDKHHLEELMGMT